MNITDTTGSHNRKEKQWVLMYVNKKIFLTFSPQYPCFYDIMSKFADERKHIKTQRHVADISYHLILYIFATYLFTK